MSRSTDLAEFLRHHRERLTPQQVGLSFSGRRRTPGLRREEVALLSGISSNWYTRLEQGRPVTPSSQALDSLAKTLRLTDIEREHMFRLARSESPLTSPPPLPTCPEYLADFIDYLKPASAIVVDPSLTIARLNDAAEQYFGDRAHRSVYRDNLLHQILADPGIKILLGGQWESIAADFIAQLRVASARWPDSGGIKTVISTLHSEPLFVRYWSLPDVSTPGPNIITYQQRHHANQPAATRFQHMAFHPSDAEYLRLIVLRPLES